MTENTKIARRQAEELEELIRGGVDSHEDEGEPMSVWEWLDENALDIEYTFNASGEYMGARVAVALGGPSVYVDTRKELVSVFWGYEVGEWSISREDANELDSVLEESAYMLVSAR